MLKSLWLNRAACHLHLGQYEQCEADSTAVLQNFDLGLPKARYRRACARRVPLATPALPDTSTGSPFKTA